MQLKQKESLYQVQDALKSDLFDSFGERGSVVT
jgi:hypothetical protein